MESRLIATIFLKLLSSFKNKGNWNETQKVKVMHYACNGTQHRQELTAQVMIKGLHIIIFLH